MEEVKADPVRPLARGTLRLQSDERLLKLFRREIEPAFDELVRRYRDSLVAYAGSIAGRDRAEDVVQESLVKAHRSLKGERDVDPRPWLYAVVRNTALNDVRDNRKHRHSDMVESAGHGNAPEDLIEQRERFAAVLAAVADLPDAQRRALVDHELSGFSHEEIAAELELSTGATKQLIYRARISLRNAFGALIPLPLVAWLAEGSGTVATGAAGAGGTATGLIGSIGGGGAAKLAVVAVVAGGSLAGGIAVEKHHGQGPASEGTARAATPGDLEGDQLPPEVRGDGSDLETASVTTAPGDKRDSARSRSDEGERRESSGGERTSGSGRTDEGPNPFHGSEDGTRGGKDRPEADRQSGEGQEPQEDSGGHGGFNGGSGSGRGDDGGSRPTGGGSEGPGSGGRPQTGGSGSSDDSHEGGSGSGGRGPSGGSGGSGSSGGSSSSGSEGSGDDGSSSGSGGSGRSGSEDD